MTEVKSTLLACTAVRIATSGPGPHQGTVVAVGLTSQAFFYYLLELPDGTTGTVDAEGYGIVRRGNQFACTVCKGDKYVNVPHQVGVFVALEKTCPACDGTGVRQPDQNGGDA